MMFEVNCCVTSEVDRHHTSNLELQIEISPYIYCRYGKDIFCAALLECNAVFPVQHTESEILLNSKCQEADIF